MRIVFPLNPCFVLWTSRSHKLPVGGKEEKILIYNQKELNKPMGILYAPLAFTRTATTAGRSPLPQGEGQGEGDRTGGNMRQPGLQIRN
ncbi:hypothetical protein KPNJ1_04405 [Klebsiella pneumoniae 30660/NJST258_1]|uniref:Uncharacterized protein n=1 Tax=Klebsiella pneumoniae 30684/NJST258_2 TaxID=1420013 RepID=W8V4M4_KLEPN|nr:hypothetical protein KPNJ2_04357 [Klebsiella pneumoniae 30684/NJST258_2]AHM86811.1 hypothetical protein KPNJ1_04405 [Klebsiella pneumoniae 30660/NJST258_1]